MDNKWPALDRAAANAAARDSRMNAQIERAVAAAMATESRDWGDTLRAKLDAAGVSEFDRMTAVAEYAERAQEMLACTTLDGEDNANALAAALDKMLEAAHDLAAEIAAMRETS